MMPNVKVTLATSIAMLIEEALPRELRFVRSEKLVEISNDIIAHIEENYTLAPKEPPKKKKCTCNAYILENYGCKCGADK
jgi:hypothetical protein